MRQLIRTCTLCFLLSTKFASANLNEHNQSSFPNLARAIHSVSASHSDLLQQINWPKVNSSLADPLVAFANWLEQATWAQYLWLTPQEIQVAQVWMLPDPENWMAIKTIHHTVFRLILTSYLQRSVAPVDPGLLLLVLSNNDASTLMIQLLKENPLLATFYLIHLQAFQQGLLQLHKVSLLLMLNLSNELEGIIADYLRGKLSPEIMIALINWLLYCDRPKEILYSLIAFIHYCLSRIKQAPQLLAGLSEAQRQAFFGFLADHHESLVNLSANSTPTAAWSFFEAAFNHAQQQLTDDQINLLQQAVLSEPPPPNEPEIAINHNDNIEDLLDEAMQQVNDDFTKAISTGGISGYSP